MQQGAQSSTVIGHGLGTILGSEGGVMGVARYGMAMATVVLGGALALTAPGVAVAASPGMVHASGKTVKALVADIGIQQPPSCVVVKQARSDRTWAAFYGKAGPGCTPGDGYAVAHRTAGKWESLPIGGSDVPCSILKAKLADAGAPASVFRDFKAGKYCRNGA